MELHIIDQLFIAAAAVALGVYYVYCCYRVVKKRRDSLPAIKRAIDEHYRRERLAQYQRDIDAHNASVRAAKETQ